MKQHNRRPSEWVKNGFIVVLALCAVYLVARAELFPTGKGPFSIQNLIGRVTHLVSGNDGVYGGGTLVHTELSRAVWPTRVAIVSANARYGAQYDAVTVGKVVDEVGALLLGEAIGSAGSAEPVSEALFRTALRQTGVYFEFPTRVPISALAKWLEVENTLLSGDVRQVILAADESQTVMLYYTLVGKDAFFACPTAISPQQMEISLAGYGSNGAAFAFESGYDMLSPYMLVGVPDPTLFALNAANPLQGEAAVETLLKELEFNPYTNSRYTDGKGNEVINESSRVVRIGTDGAVVYRSSVDGAKVHLASKGESPSDAEMIEGTLRLAERTLAASSGDATLALTGFWREGDATRVRFSYFVDGVEVLLRGTGYAAEFVVKGGSVTQAELCFRTYTKSAERALILPETQAIAAMGKTLKAPANMYLGYFDNGGDLADIRHFAR